jgi:hypothetical protein
MRLPDGYSNNNGLGFVSFDSDNSSFPITLDKLDNIFTPNEKFRLMKIDVEGHELSVLQGAELLLKYGCFEYIIFEENNSIPSLLTNFLEQNGFTIFRVLRGWKGVVLEALSSSHIKNGWDSSNFIAIHNTVSTSKFQSFYQFWKFSYFSKNS